MNEEVVVYGKNNPGVVPHLELWEWPIALYLFLGGLAAGILFFAAYYFLTGKSKEYSTAVKWSMFVVPPALIIGLLALFADLKNKILVWRLYTTISFESPMSWGAWTLLVITPLSIIWCLSYQKELFPGFLSKFKFLERVTDFGIRFRKPMAVAMMLLAIVLGIYTGILLSAFNARPLWNTSILGFLFLTSGLSTGAAMNIWMSKEKKEINLFRKIDIGLIAAELVLITHLFMGMLAGPAVHVEAANLFLGGPYTWSFWLMVVGLGLLVPLTLEFLELRGKRIPHFLVPLLILVGGLIFRIIMVHAGQISSYT